MGWVGSGDQMNFFFIPKKSVYVRNLSETGEGEKIHVGVASGTQGEMLKTRSEY